jgi:cell division protein ZapD
MANAKRGQPDDLLVFEYPLAERMRGFLRLESALAKTRERMASDSPNAARDTLTHLIELSSLTERNELKREILSELDRQRLFMEELANSVAIDSKRLNQAVYSLDQVHQAVTALPRQLGQNLRGNEFLSLLKSRSSIPGATCAFDLPALHFWLARPATARNADLTRWMEPLRPVEEALAVLLGHIRQSASPDPATASGGIYEYAPERKNPPLLLRIGLPVEGDLYPQVSGGKHRITIQFQRWRGVEERTEPLREDVDFSLALCRL